MIPSGFENRSQGRGCAPTGRAWRPVRTKNGTCADGSPEPSDTMGPTNFVHHRMRHGGMKFCSHILIVAFFLILSAFGCASSPQTGKDLGKTAAPLERPDYKKYGEEPRAKLTEVAKKREIVYSRLADYLVRRFNLSEREGIGVDIGGGSGDLIIHLAERTGKFYWINADINTGYARSFASDILDKNIAYRTGFIFADACAMPFKDNYADLIVSRGSYQFWPDLKMGLREIHRVLRPGGEAFLGRGVAPTMPEEEAKKLAEMKLIGGPKYDPDKDAERFRKIMDELNIHEFEVIRHKPEDPTLNYGVWLYFKKD
jgi:SAM-dependent methyltransferase